MKLHAAKWEKVSDLEFWQCKHQRTLKMTASQIFESISALIKKNTSYKLQYLQPQFTDLFISVLWLKF